MKIFLTHIGEMVGPRIEAFDHGHAAQLLAGTGIELDGEHMLTISREGFTEEDADRICKDLCDSY